eukprot:3972141-Prymnesium_polylepis.1
MVRRRRSRAACARRAPIASRASRLTRAPEVAKRRPPRLRAGGAGAYRLLLLLLLLKLHQQFCVFTPTAVGQSPGDTSDTVHLDTAATQQ